MIDASAALPREHLPRGFTGRLASTQFGLYLAVLTPLTGGLSVKIQHLAGVDAAPAQLGLVSGTGAVFAMVCQPLAGRLSDHCSSRFGMRRPFIAGGIGGIVVGLTCCAFATSVPMLLVGWCLAQGAANVAFAATGATVADQVPDNQRGRVSGIVGAVTPVGVLAGALLLTVLPTDVWRFLVPTAVASGLGFWFVLRLPDRVRGDAPAEPLRLRELLMSFVFDPRAHPDFGWAWLSKFLIMLGYGALSGYLTLFLAADFGMADTDEQLQFNALANTAGVLPLVLFSVVGGYLSDRVGSRKTLRHCRGHGHGCRAGRRCRHTVAGVLGPTGADRLAGRAGGGRGYVLRRRHRLVYRAAAEPGRYCQRPGRAQYRQCAPAVAGSLSRGCPRHSAGRGGVARLGIFGVVRRGGLLLPGGRAAHSPHHRR